MLGFGIGVSRDEPAVVAPATIRRFDELAARGDLYGHWQRQAEHARRLAETAKAYPRRERRRRVAPSDQP